MKPNYKKRRLRESARFRKKRENMKSPFTITIIVLILFVVLIIFSILNGPIKTEPEIKVEKDGGDTSIMTNNVKFVVKKTVDPTVNINLAMASNDISKCNSDKYCEDLFYSSKAKESEDCSKVINDEIRSNCIDNTLFKKSLENNDKEHCLNIKNADTKRICLEEN